MAVLPLQADTWRQLSSHGMYQNWHVRTGNHNVSSKSWSKLTHNKRMTDKDGYTKHIVLSVSAFYCSSVSLWEDSIEGIRGRPAAEAYDIQRFSGALRPAWGWRRRHAGPSSTWSCWGIAACLWCPRGWCLSEHWEGRGERKVQENVGTVIS